MNPTDQQDNSATEGSTSTSLSSTNEQPAVTHGAHKIYVISSRQASSMIASTLIGTSVLTLPRVSVQMARESGWMTVVLGCLMTMFLISVVVRLAQRNPSKTIIQYGAELLGVKKYPIVGKIIGFPIFLSFFVYWCLATVVVARVFGEVVITTVLVRTPLEVVLSSMLIVAFVFVMYNEEVMARVNEVLLPIIVIPVLLIALSALPSARMENIFPVFQVDWLMLLKGTMVTAGSYLGFEIMTLFLANSHPSKKMMKSSLVGVAIPGFVYMMICIAGISVFGVQELELLAWPTLELVKTSEMPGLILERLESAFLAVWVAAVFTTVGNMYYAASKTASQLFRVRNHRWVAALLLPVLYVMSLHPPNIQQLFVYAGILGQAGMTMFTIIPIFFLILSYIRQREKTADIMAKEGPEQ